MITLNELLINRKFDFYNDTILVRHKDNRYKIDMFDLIEKGYFEYYQSTQTKKIFENKKYMIAFIGTEQFRAVLYKVYKINGSRDSDSVIYPDGFLGLFPDWGDEYGKSTWYDLEPMPGFEDLEQRVVIDWGQSAVSWVQNYNEKNAKEVVEILPKGHVKDFTDYLDFTLTHNELKKLHMYKDANKRWVDKLSSVNGIYLILDKKTGNQYVGAAYSRDGIWGRWESYASNGHGNNKLLMELMKEDDGYASNFQWAVLETLPANLTKEKIISYEKRYKEKLGTKFFGLNLN